MARYVDAENAKSYIYGQFVDRFPKFTLYEIVEGVDDIETEDVAPVVHAHWYHRPNVWGEAYCSNCDYAIYTNDTNYCSNCGAKMDEEVDT